MQSKWLGLFALALALLLAFVWIPLDVETGFFEKVRRSVQIGDAFAPTVAAFMIGLGGVVLLFTHSQIASTHRADGSNSPAVLSRLAYPLIVLLLITIGFGLMRYAGPVAVAWFHAENIEYRLLRDTTPWKYVGFVLGGTFLIAALIAWVERKLKAVHVLVGLIATLVLIGIYDLPFDDLLLPPNGDV